MNSPRICIELLEVLELTSTSICFTSSENTFCFLSSMLPKQHKCPHVMTELNGLPLRPFVVLGAFWVHVRGVVRTSLDFNATAKGLNSGLTTKLENLSMETAMIH